VEGKLQVRQQSARRGVERFTCIVSSVLPTPPSPNTTSLYNGKLSFLSPRVKPVLRNTVGAEEVGRTVLASQRFEIKRSDRRDLSEAEVDGRSVLASPGLGAELSRLSSKGEPSRDVKFGSRKTSPCSVLTVCESIDREVGARALLEAGLPPLDVGGLRRDDTPECTIVGWISLPKTRVMQLPRLQTPQTGSSRRKPTKHGSLQQNQCVK
jgi:hypothetical protein